MIKLFLLLLVSGLASAQTFTFDLVTKYNMSRGSDERSCILYSNSDGSCTLKMQKAEKGTVARIIELRTGAVHYYDVTESDGSVYFSYIETDSIDMSKLGLHSYEFEPVTIKNDKKTLKVKKFLTNEKGKAKEVSRATLTLSPNEKSLFFIYRASCQDEPFGRPEWDTNETGLVESAIEETFSGTRAVTLEYCKPVDVKVTLPATLKQKMTTKAKDDTQRRRVRQ